MNWQWVGDLGRHEAKEGTPQPQSVLGEGSLNGCPSVLGEGSLNG